MREARFLLAGGELLGIVGAAAVESAVAGGLAKPPVHVPPSPGIERPRARYELATVALRDEFTLEAIKPKRGWTTQQAQLPLATVDATLLPWAVYRLRPM